MLIRRNAPVRRPPRALASAASVERALLGDPEDEKLAALPIGDRMLAQLEKAAPPPPPPRRPETTAIRQAPSLPPPPPPASRVHIPRDALLWNTTSLPSQGTCTAASLVVVSDDEVSLTTSSLDDAIDDNVQEASFNDDDNDDRECDDSDDMPPEAGTSKAEAMLARLEQMMQRAAESKSSQAPPAPPAKEMASPLPPPTRQRTQAGMRRDALSAVTAALRRAEVSEANATRRDNTAHVEACAVNATLKMIARDFESSTGDHHRHDDADVGAVPRVRWGPRARALRRECHV